MKLGDKEENIKMGEIKRKKNKFYFIPNLQEELEDLNGDKAFSWLIFKGEKFPLTKNKYKIKEGDIFRLARLYFIVRGIHIQKKKLEQKDTNCLISYHSKINQSLNINEDYINNEIIDDNSSDSSNTDICEDDNENDEDNNDKIIKISKFGNKEQEKKKNKLKSKFNKKKKKKDKDKNLIINIKPKVENNHFNTDESKKSEKQKICRICYMGEIDKDINPLIKPCKCSGSMKYIHFKCLLHWLKTKIQMDKSEYIENNYFSVYSPETVQCELCKEYLPHFIRHNNKLFNLTELEQNFDSDVKGQDSKNNKEKSTENNNEFWDENYIVLDTMSPDKEITPYRYIVKFAKNKIIKIGRGLDMNLILSDLSISRNHCQLELYDNGDIFLKDNNSKFGTLVLVQAKSIEILKGQTLTIQAGRTFFNISYKNNFSLFNCCKAEDIDLKITYEKINNKSIKLGKNNAILTESESESEGGEGDGKDKDKDKNYKNEYDNNIKKLNNKKIKIMKISKKDKKENTDTNIINNINNKEINNTNQEISITEEKKENNNKSKKKLINLKKSDDDEENEKNKGNNKKNDNNKEELNYKDNKDDN